MSVNDLKIKLCSFGVISDIQYADCSNGINFERTQTRYYRRSLKVLTTAISDWKSKDNVNSCAVSFIINLGDIIDGVNKKNKYSEQALDTVLNMMETGGIPVYHVWGNHDFYNFSRKWMLASSRMNPCLVNTNFLTKLPGCTVYCHFSPIEGYRIVLLDQYEVSMLGNDSNSEYFVKAEKILQCNKNDDLNSPTGMIGRDARFVKFNGGISEEQLHWLDDVLKISEQNQETVILGGHLPLKTADFLCLCWNYEAILDVVYKYNCVLTVISGHTHQYSYICDIKGIHHITLPGVIETEPDVDAAHGTMTLYKDRIELEGNGSLPSMTMPIQQKH